ncbi:MAG: hypothetical protein VB095_14080 [Anaerovorax sp.]|nr:hypothetical protein [Anaerovorax sp.]
MRIKGEYQGLIWECCVTENPTNYGKNQGRVYYLEIIDREKGDGYTLNHILYRFENGWTKINQKSTEVSEVIKYVLEQYN